MTVIQFHTIKICRNLTEEDRNGICEILTLTVTLIGLAERYDCFQF